jgi:hypothetical protein
LTASKPDGAEATAPANISIMPASFVFSNPFRASAVSLIFLQARKLLLCVPAPARQPLRHIWPPIKRSRPSSRKSKKQGERLTRWVSTDRQASQDWASRHSGSRSLTISTAVGGTSWGSSPRSRAVSTMTGQNWRKRSRPARSRRLKLVVAKLDRLSRNLAFIATLMDSGVEFIAVDNPHANKLTIHILAAVAQHEREIISARTSAALKAAKALGKRLGNPKLSEARRHAALAAP